MTDPGDLSYAVLGRVAEFVRRLTPEQARSLAQGDATLTLTPRSENTTKPVRVNHLPVEPAAIRTTLSGLADRASAARYLDDLRLTTPQLRTLAKELGLAVSSSATKAAVRDTIVQWTVGRRVDAAVLGRPAEAR